ncbi:unnamed protein product [Echinostoma caproni]|uniref:Uncharacterized protein n=1 Tax=Echinostoma caproni TaxID=27848 RepID=A0A183BBD8_9TREM|nr:unnamed protein product [Echinostoma caproni]
MSLGRVGGACEPEVVESQVEDAGVVGPVREDEFADLLLVIGSDGAGLGLWATEPGPTPASKTAVGVLGGKEVRMMWKQTKRELKALSPMLN